MEIHAAEFIKSSTDYKGCPEGNFPEFAFIGRSNVGKSSLINMLCQRKNLALTSSKPGKTLLINHFLINKNWYLVDLPGYGFAQTGKENRKKLIDNINNYILFREQLTCLFVLIDVRHEPQKIDLEFMEWLGSNGIPFCIVFTKTDKLSASKIDENIENYKQKMLENWEQLPPFFKTSSHKKIGREEILNFIDKIIESLKVQ
ncbi:MAG: putative GTP-binding protein EngB [Bacteroidetes bacterium ADurb.BinA395]|jgi:GTP-binding protein|nr:YihA family ribosome biogenesis GTP-binding protein [Paludibacteraceae bacterium]OPZ01888.1 MAG: putative GTP-binding protein EngB [Bacteroidetes bacterium ADurb.BinA395]HOF99242.1 ribosome biogenesis GTP-binding protein YihA/YsxC [Paludibacteraceae bacterium]HOR39217.1 ribosome biogenesis GTP-binding protein YihA/YsxC [Paludibacteraceae bacterium]